MIRAARRAPALLLALLASGCGGDDPARPNGGTEVRILFHEPRSFCLAADAAGDTLLLHNLGEADVTWTPQHVPAGAANLDEAVVVPTGTIVAIVWTWDPPGALPAADSLVAATDDPALPRVVVPFRREIEDDLDVDPPPAPALALPPDEAVFHPGDVFEILWSRVSDCSGISHYQVQISDTPSFSRILLSQNLPATSGVIEVDPGDADLGPAFWRVRAFDRVGLSSAWSAVRRWTVTPVSG